MRLLLALSLAASGCASELLGTKECTLGAVECTGGGAGRICDYRGKWVGTNCPVGQTCIDDGKCDEFGENCVDACVNVICEPGSRSCDTNHVYVVQCNETGTDWCYRSDCAAPPVNGVCDEGRCIRSEEHTSELQSLAYLVCRLLL